MGLTVEELPSAAGDVPADCARDTSAVPHPPAGRDRDERRSLARALELGLAPLAPPVAVLDGVRSLERHDAAVVLTTARPALLGSPLDALYRGLHAVRLARSLSQAWECPVVPVLWVEGDGHRLDGVHPVWMLNENLDLQKVGVSGFGSSRRPLNERPLDARQHGLDALRAELGRRLASAPHLERALDLVLPRAGEPLVRAFTRMALALLGHLGLVPLEPTWRREALSRALGRIIELDPGGQAAPGEATDVALVYRVDPGGRHPLRRGGEGFRYDGEPGSRTAVELAAEIVQDPHGWSFGDLLLPFGQELCLPVVARIGRWSSDDTHWIAKLRESAGLPEPARVDGLRCTLIDPDTQAALDLLGLDPAAAVRGDLEPLTTRPGGGSGQRPGPAGRLRDIGQRASRDLLACREELRELDGRLVANLRRTAQQVRRHVERYAEKVARAEANRSGRPRRALRRVRNGLRPLGRSQGEVLGPLPFLAHLGDAWPEQLLAHVRAFPLAPLLVRMD